MPQLLSPVIFLGLSKRLLRLVISSLISLVTTEHPLQTARLFGLEVRPVGGWNRRSESPEIQRSNHHLALKGGEADSWVSAQRRSE
jgi:hypothetical protein